MTQGECNVEDEVMYNPDKNFQFEASTHTYRLNGVVLPSVTQVLSILSDFSMVDPAYLAEKADLGEKVHQTLEYFDKGTLNESILHPVLAQYLEAWKKFLADTKFTPVETETAYVHHKYYYAGRIDRIGIIDNTPVLIDIKSGVQYKTHALQTAAYAMLYNQNKSKKEQVKRRWAVYIRTDGYKIEKHVNDADERVFLAALTIHNYKTTK